MNPLEIAAARSRWAQVNVGEKALLILGMLVLAITLPPLPALPMLALAVLVLAILARVPARLFALLITAPAAFVAVGLGPLIVAITPAGIAPIDGGLQHAAEVFGRSIVGTAATMLFALTTPIAELLAFGARLRIPPALLQLVSVTYRLTCTLITTSRNLWQTQASRLGHSSWRRWLRSAGDQAATLFVLSYQRARALESGLDLRADPASVVVLGAVRPVRWHVVVASVCVQALIVWLSWRFRS